MTKGFRWIIPALIIALSGPVRGIEAAAATAGPTVFDTGQMNPAAPSFAPKPYEAISLFGRPLVSPAATAAALKSYEAARSRWSADPSEDNWIWLGRRTAYLGRFREAVAVYSEGLKKFPDSYRLYRHRGHRYISLRQFGRAIADFEKAAELAAGKPLEIEPDGAPNSSGTPVSNTQFNIYYHLGLACYLTRDFAKAEAAYRECLRWSNNDDSVVATSDWLTMTLRRTGKTDEARALLNRFHPKMKMIENGAYLERLMMFKGEVSVEDFGRDRPGESAPEKAIRSYGLGLIRLWNGDKAGARKIFEEMLQDESWASFAAIAAEAELADLVRTEPDLASAGATLLAWSLSWNLYDLDLAEKLFERSGRTSYFSSEKPGRIEGFDGLVEHSRSFGFVPGGKTSDNRLWLEDVRVLGGEDMALATAIWHFDRDAAGPSPAQRGPVTFVFLRDGEIWKILHAHFANDPK